MQRLAGTIHARGCGCRLSPPATRVGDARPRILPVATPPREENPMRYLPLVARFVPAWGTAALLAATLAGVGAAAPAPIPAGSKLVFNFNVIGYPAGQTY